MAAIKEESDAHELQPLVSVLEYQLNDADSISMTSPLIKGEAKQEEACDVAIIKEEVRDEIKTGEHKVCLDSIEDFLVKEEYGTTSSATDVAECLEDEWDYPEGTDPLLLSETNGGSSCILPPYSGNDKNKGRKCELNNTQTLSHRSDNSFRCEICKKCFKLRQTLVDHIRMHTGETPFKCDLCNKSFTRRVYLKTHSRIYTGKKPFECEVCHKVFRKFGNLWAHSRIHTGEKNFKSEVCNKCYSEHLCL